MPDFVWQGDPGSAWTNDTDKVWWQFECSFVNSCEYCMSLHSTIAPFPFPIPMHEHCGCYQEPVMPGTESGPFVNFDDYLRGLSDGEKERSIGESLWKLIQKKVVGWEDVVTPDRIKTLAEVVKSNRLSVEDLIKAGVSKAVADRAANYSKAEVSEIIKRHRDELIKVLSSATKWADELRKGVAAGIGGTPFVGYGGVPGWPSQQRLPMVSAARLPGLPLGDKEMAAKLAVYLKKWPNVPVEDLAALVIVEEETRKKKENARAR